MCEPRGPEVTDRTVLLFRHAPSRTTDVVVSSMHFRPIGDAHEECLSVARADKTTAEEAYRLASAPRPHGLQLKDVGEVWAFSVEEAHSVGLKVFDDPDPGPPANDAHAVVRYERIGRSQSEKKAKQLRNYADARRVQFKASSNVEVNGVHSIDIGSEEQP